MSEGITRESMLNTEKLIGKTAVAYRKGVNVPVRIIRIDKTSRRFVYELLAGPNKGEIFNSRFSEEQTADIYNEENAVLAFLVK